MIAYHSREIGNILLYYYHLENINGGKEKWWPGRNMIWVLVGVRGCVLRPTGHGLVTLFSLSVSVKDRPLHWTLGKSRIYYPKHTLGYGHREDLLLSCHGFWLFLDRLSGWFFGWRSKHRTKYRTQGWGPRVQVWTGTWTPWQEGSGLVLLVLGVQAGLVFRGTQLGTLIRESPVFRYGMSII